MIPAAPLGTVSKRVLIVEDDPMTASCIEHFLSESGYEVVGLAASASAALSLAAEHQPDLALLDIGLTGPFDGIELACLLRRRFSIPTIFLSGSVDHETMQRARVAQPLDFLCKPFRPSGIFNAIERVMESNPALA